MCIRDRPYVAEKMGVTASTILRYENGSIDNTKKMVLEGLSEALHVSVEDVYKRQVILKKIIVNSISAINELTRMLIPTSVCTEDVYKRQVYSIMIVQENKTEDHEF